MDECRKAILEVLNHSPGAIQGEVSYRKAHKMNLVGAESLNFK